VIHGCWYLWLISIKIALLHCLILICLRSGSSSASVAETSESKAVSALAPKVVFLCDFATFFQPVPELRSSWKVLDDPSLDTHNLTLLLKSPDPKIRSLAIFAFGPQKRPARPLGNCSLAVRSYALVPVSPAG
jgi:hypothetical protein